MVNLGFLKHVNASFYRKMDAKPSPERAVKKPRAPCAWTFDERFNKAKDFIRFLETEKIKLSEGMTKKKIHRMYYSEYRTYRQQVAPSEKLLPYHLCMDTLFNRNLFHVQGNSVFKGARPLDLPKRERRFENRKTDNKTVSEETAAGVKDENTNNNSAAGSVTRRRRRVRSKRNKNIADEKPVIPDHSVKKQMADRLQSLRRKRQWPVKVAVDQHLTMHRREPETEEVCEQEGAGVNVADMKYIKKVEDENLFACRVCHTTCTSEADVDKHLKGKVHRLAVVMDRLKTMR